MRASTLFDEGWKQGSLIRATLSVRTFDHDNGNDVESEQSFDIWLLTTQDCDLASTKSKNAARQFELRPVYAEQKGDTFDGIRSRAMRVAPGLVLRSDSPRITMTARRLVRFNAQRDNILTDEQRREVKTWLGLRYDRPAVPEPFDRLAKDVLKPVIVDAMPDILKGRVRDVLVYYESATAIRLIAVLRDAADRDAALDWLDSAIGTLLDKHKIAVLERHAEDASRVSLRDIETYYGLDSSELSLTMVDSKP